MNKIETIKAVGHVLCHDITRIVKGEMKDAQFKKGHIVTQEDIPMLLSMGKDHLFVYENNGNMLHENEAAEILCKLCKNNGMEATPVKEGKIELIAKFDGLFRVDVKRLNSINEIDDISIATRHTNYPVKKGDKLAGMRVIPLIIERKKMEEVKKVAGDKPLMEILPYKKMKAGVITTGNEVFYGRIEDTFTPVIIEKLLAYEINVTEHITVNDDSEKIAKAILKLKSSGVDMIICTGGMSVDPDDLTPSAIRNAGAKIISYGSPVLPGAMFLMSYFEDNTPVMGLPACVMYVKASVFDFILPRIVTKVKITKKDLALMGHGGLCLGCKICHYPNCGFGKGII